MTTFLEIARSSLEALPEGLRVMGLDLGIEIAPRTSSDHATWFTAAARSTATDFRMPSIGDIIMSSCSIESTSS